jgi:hypothetical protein
VVIVVRILLSPGRMKKYGIPKRFHAFQGTDEQYFQGFIDL